QGFKSLAEHELSELHALYGRAMQLEIEFFSAQPIHPPLDFIPLFSARRPTVVDGRRVLFACDFDLTCTASESTQALAEAAICADRDRVSQRHLVVNEKVGPATEENTLCDDDPCDLMPSDGREEEVERTSGVSDKRAQWERLCVEYMDGYWTTMNEMLSKDAGSCVKRTLQDVFKGVGEYEILANQKVADSGFLQGMRKEDVAARGRSNCLFPGCARVFSDIICNKGIDIHIVSVTWSLHFIKSTLGSVLPHDVIDRIHINANELEWDSDGKSTGKILYRLQTPLDKLCILKATMASRFTTQQNRDSAKSTRTTFTGGSSSKQRDDSEVEVVESLVLERMRQSSLEDTKALEVCKAVDDSSRAPRRGGMSSLNKDAECRVDMEGGTAVAAAAGNNGQVRQEGLEAPGKLQAEQSGGRQGGSAPFIVFIGDSLTDLPPMLEADIGIVMRGGGSTFRTVAEEYNIQIEPLLGASIAMAKAYNRGSPWSWLKQSGVIYSASSWEELEVWFVGLSGGFTPLHL
ncbi:hypothetical protein CBR_g64517, partial [Chara braunii]